MPRVRKVHQRDLYSVLNERRLSKCFDGRLAMSNIKRTARQILAGLLLAMVWSTLGVLLVLAAKHSFKTYPHHGFHPLGLAAAAVMAFGGGAGALFGRTWSGVAFAFACILGIALAAVMP